MSQEQLLNVEISARSTDVFIHVDMTIETFHFKLSSEEGGTPPQRRRRNGEESEGNEDIRFEGETENAGEQVKIATQKNEEPKP